MLGDVRIGGIRSNTGKRMIDITMMRFIGVNLAQYAVDVDER